MKHTKAFELREYQQQAVKDIKDYMKSDNNKKVIVVQPCAAGKSILIAETAAMTKKPVLVIQPSKELLLQNFSKYTAMGFDASIFSASAGVKEIGHVTYATPGSIKTIARDFKKLGVELVCIDECHLGTKAGSMISKILKEIKPKKVVGFTATPCIQHATLQDGTRMLMLNRTAHSIFGDFIHVTQVKNLTDNGYWSPVQINKVDFDGRTLVQNSSGTEYTMDSIVRTMELNNTVQKIVSTFRLLREEGRERVLIFVPLVSHANDVARASGGLIKVVSNETSPADREQILRDFDSGKIHGVVNCATLGTGYDNPKIDAIIMGKPTKSYISFYQEYGRGVRISPNKKDVIVVDLVGNIERFGTPEQLEIIDYESYGWGMFYNGKLLTGVSLDRPAISKKDLITKFGKASDPVIWFGKHKGKTISEIPDGYLTWMLKNDWTNLNGQLKAFLKDAEFYLKKKEVERVL